MKISKLVLKYISTAFISIVQRILAFFYYFYTTVRGHPVHSITIFIGITALIITSLNLYYNRQESKEEKKTEVTLRSRIDFNHIYFTNFDTIEVFEPKISWDEPWPEYASDMGEFRFFGLQPLVGLNIRNDSKHSISISYISGRIFFSNYIKDRNWQEYFDQHLRKLSKFPLFVQPYEEKLILVPFTWPITKAVRERLPNLTTDSLHGARYLVDAYYRNQKIGIIAFETEYEKLLKDILVEDLNKQIGKDSKAISKIELKVILSTGEYFSTIVSLQ